MSRSTGKHRCNWTKDQQDHRDQWVWTTGSAGTGGSGVDGIEEVTNSIVALPATDTLAIAGGTGTTVFGYQW